jgi:hypothetical protein
MYLSDTVDPRGPKGKVKQAMSFNIPESDAPEYDLEKMRKELEQVRYELEEARKERKFGLLMSSGLLVVVFLALYMERRSLAVGAFFVVFLVMTFLRCRWGIGDLEMTLPQSIGVTLALAAMFLLIWLFWGGR